MKIVSMMYMNPQKRRMDRESLLNWEREPKARTLRILMRLKRTRALTAGVVRERIITMRIRLKPKPMHWKRKLKPGDCSKSSLVQ